MEYKLLIKLSFDGEIWAPIGGDFDDYCVSNYGRAFNLKRKKMLKGSKTLAGYWRYTLKDNFGVKKYKYGHKLAAEAFLPNEDNKPNVVHIDENKINNYVGSPEANFTDGNLVWVTVAEGNNMGTRIERVRKANSMKINQYDIDGNFIQQHQSLSAAAALYGITTGAISAVAKHKPGRHTAAGYVWEYAEQ